MLGERERRHVFTNREEAERERECGKLLDKVHRTVENETWNCLGL